MALRLRARFLGAPVHLVSVPVFLDSVAQSITFPILPRLTQSLLGGDMAEAALWVGWLEVAWAAAYFLAAPVLGGLSDHFGRRPSFLVSLAGVAAELLLDVFAPNVWWLLAGRVLCGLTFGAQVAVMAYVADVTEPEKRAGAYGWVNGALFSGIVVGPLAGGILAQVDLRAPFWAGAALASTGAAYVGLVLPESLPKDHRAPFNVSQTAPWDALRFLLARRALAPLAVVLLLTWLAIQSSDNMLVLYTAYRYGWTPLEFGVFVGVAASLSIVVQGWLAGRFVERFGDHRALIAGLSLQALGLTGMGLAGTGILFWTVALGAVFGALARPALQSLMSAAVGPDEQGRLQGGVGAVSSLTSIVAPLVFTQLFAWSIGGAREASWSGATILAGASLSAAAAFVAWHAARTSVPSARST